MNKKLIRMIKNAHASEVGAFYAYGGHWRSSKDALQRVAVKNVQRDEMDHVAKLAEMLHDLGDEPCPHRVYLFSLVGRMVSMLCYVSSARMKFLGAALIEKIGVKGYSDLEKEANRIGQRVMAVQFGLMGLVESEHDITMTILKEKS